MSRTCALTGKKRHIANNVSHAHNKTKKIQLPNLQTKRLFLESEGRFVRVRLSARALRTVSKKGLDAFLTDSGLSVRDIAS